ncbi:hypothetical protein KQH60_01905 [Mycetohabitans sp. B8]|uniref:MJ0042-type zinc finger domain-containing protein n=1 Tax=Mycetohabitans sp. B8 TaxID=2841845 RepID=UPI001F4909D9|nr:MJ0042-type zinc finger domain-containing protein [Mycetohabitans sp. B8]MCG1041386.1 hypothetical protein [Mycetohabitans sp. B8]
MTLATRYLRCGTTIYRLTADQLKLRHGVVRCGHCLEILDGAARQVEPWLLTDVAARPDDGCDAGDTEDGGAARATANAPARARAPALTTGHAWAHLEHDAADATLRDTAPITGENQAPQILPHAALDALPPAAAATQPHAAGHAVACQTRGTAADCLFVTRSVHATPSLTRRQALGPSAHRHYRRSKP